VVTTVYVVARRELSLISRLAAVYKVFSAFSLSTIRKLDERIEEKETEEETTTSGIF
jgi:hypothetical protein